MKGTCLHSDARGTEQGAWVQFGCVFYSSSYLAESQRLARCFYREKFNHPFTIVESKMI